MRTIVALFFVIAAAYAANLLAGDSPTAIPGSYIVVLNENVSPAQRDLHMMALMGLKADDDSTSAITNAYQIGEFIGFSASLSPEMLKDQLAHPDVKYVEAQQVFKAYTKTQVGATWGLDRIDQRALPLGTSFVYNKSAGAGSDVWVIDTGIYTKNVDFGGRAHHKFNAYPDEKDDDFNGHGTHCAGTVGGALYGVSKGVTLYAVKVLSEDGSGTTAGVIAGVQYVATNKNAKPTIASMSLGGGASSSLDSAVTAAIGKGVIFVVAAGNENSDACLSSPARVPLAITVAASDSKDSRASYSNWGSCVDIFAPGSSIDSDWIGAPDAHNVISGTSMATPHVSGVLALHLGDHPKDNTVAAATAWLKSVATKNAIKDVKGSPNVLLYAPY